MDDEAHNPTSDTGKDCYNEKNKSTQPTISRNIGGSILLLAWHACSSPNKAVLVCPVLQKGIVIWEYFFGDNELIKLSTINNNNMHNFSKKISLCDQYILTAFKNENGKKYLRIWDLDNIEKNSLNKDMTSPSTSGGPESNAGGAGPINLISNSDERIIGCSISGDGMYAGTVYSSGKIQVWNTVSSQLLDSIECLNAYRIAFSMYGE